jgi:quercetin dioxygenase-like cupin family protein
MSDAATTLDILGVRIEFLLRAGQSASGMSVLIAALPPGRVVPPHVATQQDMTLHVLDGDFAIEAEGATDGWMSLPPGRFIVLPRQRVRAFGNRSGTAVRMLMTVTPGAGAESLLEQLARTAPAAGPDLASLCEQHGITLLG